MPCLAEWPAPDGCGGHGRCIVPDGSGDESSPDAYCECDPGWFGFGDVYERSGHDCSTHELTLVVGYALMLALSVFILGLAMQRFRRLYVAQAAKFASPPPARGGGAATAMGVSTVTTKPVRVKTGTLVPAAAAVAVSTPLDTPQTAPASAQANDATSAPPQLALTPAAPDIQLTVTTPVAAAALSPKNRNAYAVTAAAAPTERSTSIPLSSRGGGMSSFQWHHWFGTAPQLLVFLIGMASLSAIVFSCLKLANPRTAMIGVDVATTIASACVYLFLNAASHISNWVAVLLDLSLTRGVSVSSTENTAVLPLRQVLVYTAPLAMSFTLPMSLPIFDRSKAEEFYFAYLAFGLFYYLTFIVSSIKANQSIFRELKAGVSTLSAELRASRLAVIKLLEVRLKSQIIAIITAACILLAQIVFPWLRHHIVYVVWLGTLLGLVGVYGYLSTIAADTPTPDSRLPQPQAASPKRQSAAALS